MKISELASATGIPQASIRFYETQGLLPAPARTVSNYRDYADEHVERLHFIRRCRSLDMELEEIRALLRFKLAPGDDCTGVNELLDEHIGHSRNHCSIGSAGTSPCRTSKTRNSGPTKGEAAPPVLAGVEELAGICRHDLALCMPATRTGQYRFELDRFHVKSALLRLSGGIAVKQNGLAPRES